MEVQGRKLVLKNRDGEAVRTFYWDGEPSELIYRQDTRRLDLVQNIDALLKEKIPFTLVDTLSAANIPYNLSSLAQLTWFESEVPLTPEVAPKKDKSKPWWVGLLALFLIESVLVTIFSLVPPVQEVPPEVIEEHTVHIEQPVKEKIIEKKQVAQTEAPKAKTQKVLKRMGVLGVLGSLAKSSQRGGLNLNAAVTSQGPGLGGSQGSGGVQTSLYAKGLVAAPLGAGGKAEGAGGYGTKGKGGGQAGYGNMSLIGSAGTEPIPLGREAIVEGGLDRDMIAEVIERNKGQINYCYEQALQSDPSLAGRIALEFTINGSGIVSSAGVKATNMNSKLVEDCIVMRLKSWKFPLPQAGVNVKVVYPFMFKRIGRG